MQLLLFYAAAPFAWHQQVTCRARFSLVLRELGVRELLRVLCMRCWACGVQESSENLAAGKSRVPTQRDQTHPLGPKARAVVQTTIEVRESPNGSCSILDVVTSDRPGLLVDVVSVLKDINVNVVSAEIDTIGNEARDEFFVTYHGEPLNGPMVQLVTNSLQVCVRGAGMMVAVLVTHLAAV